MEFLRQDTRNVNLKFFAIYFLFSLQQWLDPNKRVLQQLKGTRHVLLFSFSFFLRRFLFFHLSLVLEICRDVRRTNGVENKNGKCRATVRTFPLTSQIPGRSFVTNSCLAL